MGIGKLLYKDIPNLLTAIRHLGSTSTVQSRGLTFKLVSDNWLTKYRARSFNEKEPEMLDWIDDNLQDNDVFFDIGANVGIYSIYAAKRNPKAIVYAFEPEYSNLHQLKINILENSLINNIRCYSLGLDNTSGISYLHIQDVTPGAALSTISNDDLEQTATGHSVVWKEGIATMTIDTFCNTTGIKPTMIKIDVDGNETNILMGGQHTFNSSELRTVYIEVDEKQTKCEEKLSDFGFVQVDKYNENQIWKKPS